ncbi:unnamed protein product [Miscanthus lutarioriparius]|uniref:H15 domain-containing protein n=1 Tax=Miscanthus lutarioriparius TaxID=422564 RepID=A0A811NQ34_9POAL|nr:unnamed protein product [Miscanthus lutarioriparius]
MAGEDGAAPPPPPPPLPSYPEMIVEAIRALGLENGSNKTAISDYIKGRYGSSLPAQHNAILTGHLARMKATSELAFLRNNYLLPDEEEEEEEEEEASPLRTDGHKDPADAEDSTGVFDATSFFLDFDEDELLAPPIVLDADDIAVPAPAPVVTADVNPVPTKRGRGRPPKPKDPVAVGSSGEPATAPPVVAADAAAVPVKRGRGRPPKPKNPVAEDSAPTAAASVVIADANAVPVKRGRGRPPKPKDPTTVGTDRATSGMLSPRGRGRGRPPKKAKVAVDDPSGEPAAAPGVAADASAVPVKRGRGRPPKVRPAVVGKPSES